MTDLTIFSTYLKTIKNNDVNILKKMPSEIIKLRNSINIFYMFDQSFVGFYLTRKPEQKKPHFNV